MQKTKIEIDVKNCKSGNYLHENDIKIKFSSTAGKANRVKEQKSQQTPADMQKRAREHAKIH